MMRKLTADEMDRCIRRSTIVNFSWGLEVCTIENEVSIWFNGSETTMSLGNACKLAMLAAAQLDVFVMQVDDLECYWGVQPDKAFWIQNKGPISVELDNCEADEFAAALRMAVASLSHSATTIRNRTDDNLRSVFG